MTAEQPEFPVSPDTEYNHTEQRSAHKQKQNPRQLTVITPADPPDFNQPAARALLRILLTAHERLRHPKSEA